MQFKTTNIQVVNLKPRWTAVGIALTALALLTLPRPALAEDQHQIKGQETGAVFPGAFQFPFHFESIAATGEASHLGHYTLTGNFAVDVRMAKSTGAYTLTTANGDTLLLSEAGHGVAVGDFMHKVSVFTITGGTGRFEGATGNITSTLTFAFPLNQDISPNPYTAVLTGTIDLADEDEQD